MSFETLIKANGCPCGKEHIAAVKNIITGHGAIEKLPVELLKLNAKKVFLFADKNTYQAAGKKVEDILKNAQIAYTKYVMAEERPEPDEQAVGSAVMHFDKSCDTILAVGSGVVNDIAKILANTAERPYIIVATAPSMDGYASATSSMALDGIKVSLKSKCADIIIGDTDILKNAPMHMLRSGLGDMLAKYISICEWRIAHLVTCEYYCEEVASLIRASLKECVENAEGLLNRDEAAVEAVFKGLTLCGLAMAYAGVSRPASGVEHYFSHIWDMRGLEFNLPTELHGIQCAYGTLLALRLYEKIKSVIPNKEKALAYAAQFDFTKWSKQLSSFLGKGAEAMIALEEKEGKYNTEKHKNRLDIIIENWDKILTIIEQELPSAEYIESFMKQCGFPLSCEEIGVEKESLKMTFMATKDIRDKYVLSRLCWDLGILEEMTIE